MPAILTLSWQRPLSYRNQSIDLLRKSMDWFLYDNGLRHERVKSIEIKYEKSMRSDFADNLWKLKFEAPVRSNF